MNLPAKIRIGAIDYSVSEWDDLHFHDNKQKRHWLNGHVSNTLAAIKVDQEMNDTRKVVTIWHEAFHALLERAGIDEQPEPILIALSFGVVEIMRANPELAKLTMEDTPPAVAEVEE